jgi:hypothetical protein
MGYAGRKPNTGNRSVRFDEEVVLERALLYSTEDDRRSHAPIGDEKPSNSRYGENQARI